MVDTVAADLTIKIIVFDPSTITYEGDVEKPPAGHIKAKSGKKSLMFWCDRPFALFVKDSNRTDLDFPFEGGKQTYGSTWKVNADQGGRFETRVTLHRDLVKYDWIDYGVAVLNAAGMIQVHDPRIIIDW